MTIGVVISTYNQPDWLAKTLTGYLYQTRRPDEIIIADDGSGPETRAVIDRFRALLPIKHAWHPDDGFRKTIILNRALLLSSADYLIFTDGDCIPRADFVETHMRNARRRRFVSGGYLKLPLDISRDITPDDIAAARPFSAPWLLSQGMRRSFKLTKLSPRRWLSRLLDRVTTARASWNGCNSSGWRADIIAAGGFDERMAYGGEDRELGERLTNAGIRGQQRRYEAIVVHLDHGRPYRNAEAMAANDQIRRETRRLRLTHTSHGLNHTGQ
ncbi:MAG: glycosyltransferase family 2 protein [Pseudoflavonifractor sp.]|nr:glycosyltransferase family 2 protein [Alloprevotella sp.]MCM1117460.1 glycosyltransferase family 2 protein [Pseudoflavonifractor sp.]